MLLCAKTYFPPPASSTASEREFKAENGFQTQTRGRLLPANLETLVFLNYNLRSLNNVTNLENPPAGFVASNSIKYDEQQEDSEEEIKEVYLSKMKDKASGEIDGSR